MVVVLPVSCGGETKRQPPFVLLGMLVAALHTAGTAGPQLQGRLLSWVASINWRDEAVTSRWCPGPGRTAS